MALSALVQLCRTTLAPLTRNASVVIKVQEKTCLRSPRKLVLVLASWQMRMPMKAWYRLLVPKALF